MTEKEKETELKYWKDKYVELARDYEESTKDFNKLKKIYQKITEQNRVWLLTTGWKDSKRGEMIHTVSKGYPFIMKAVKTLREEGGGKYKNHAPELQPPPYDWTIARGQRWEREDGHFIEICRHALLGDWS